MARALPQTRIMAATSPASPSPTPSPSPCPRPVGFHGAVSDFKRRLIEATLTQSGGNRTRAARALGLQRTYLLRLIREFDVRVPPAPMPPRRGDAKPPPVPAAPAQTR